MIYNNIIDLPLNRFIKVVCGNDIKGLIIDGEHTDEELLEAWAIIQQEYSDAIGDSDYIMYLNLLRNVTILSMNYNTLKSLAELLQNVPLDILVEIGEDRANELKNDLKYFADTINKILLTNFNFDIGKKEEFQKELGRVLTRSKKYWLDWQLKVQQMEHIEATNKTEQDGKAKITREYFYQVLITLTDFAKVPLTDQVSVYEYCDRMRRYNAYHEKLNSQTKAR